MVLPSETIQIDDALLLRRFRAVCVRLRALETNPHAYNADETDRRIQEHADIFREIIVRYAVDVTRAYTIDIHTGLIYFDD